ncbi:MAG: hypothetical protein J6W98_01490 [Bacteroidales bacterium]|nr:hypothetical protein [Bacteroidales bacterium]
MNELEKYLREHAAEFDTAAPAEGHEERFLARLAATPLPRQASRKPSRLAAFLRVAWIPAFACAALALALVLIRPGDPFRKAGNDPEAIYLVYMDEVSRLYEKAPVDDSFDRDEAIRSITEEQDPYFAQLPEEYNPRKRARMLRSYYAGLLALAQEVNDTYIN